MAELTLADRSQAYPRIQREDMPDTAVMLQIDHEVLVRRGRRLAYWTLFFTSIEAALALFAGQRAESTALIGFGVDSLIEVFSAGVVLWRLRVGALGESREKLALKLIGASLLILAAYVAVEGIHTLSGGYSRPAPSLIGLGMAVGSLISMQWLTWSKRRVAVELDSGAVHADSVQSQICSYLAAILLAGLGLNALFHWWWADPVAALVMAPFIAKEGLEAWRGQACACSHVPHEH
jgi:divalent metal cation (Fe/Co/Zn/Cd) transporter